jgi:hypothetical protein
MLCSVILHAASLRLETDGFTSPPKEVRTTDLGKEISRCPLQLLSYARDINSAVVNGKEKNED